MANAMIRRLVVEAKAKGRCSNPLRPVKIYLDGRKDTKPQNYYTSSEANHFFVGVGINWLIDNLNEEEIAELMIFRMEEKFEGPCIMFYPKAMRKNPFLVGTVYA